MRFVSTMLRTILAIALTMGVSVATAGELVTNGGFEQTGMTVGTQMSTTNVTDWSTTGYNFIFFPGTADTTGSYTTEYQHQLYLWGPGGGTSSPQYSNNGLPAASPAGGNFVAADGAYQVGAITQTINGLTAGDQYVLTFYWAGAQQSGYTGATTEQWKVSLGSETLSTTVLSNLSHGFTGWVEQTFIYTATSASEVLSFLSVGTPGGEPPFSLLDGVSMIAMPEPAGWTILLVGAAAAAFLRRRRAT